MDETNGLIFPKPEEMNYVKVYILHCLKIFSVLVQSTLGVKFWFCIIGFSKIKPRLFMLKSFSIHGISILDLQLISEHYWFRSISAVPRITRPTSLFVRNSSTQPLIFLRQRYYLFRADLILRAHIKTLFIIQLPMAWHTHIHIWVKGWLVNLL